MLHVLKSTIKAYTIIKNSYYRVNPHMYIIMYMYLVILTKLFAMYIKQVTEYELYD